ncbi:Gamma-glutamylputrescine oxidoreductase, partial [Lachnellula willkommii]
MTSFNPKPFPWKTSTTPYWRTELDPLDEHRSTEELPVWCDILIIGGGYAGIAAAYHLLCSEESEGREIPSIVLLEARQACSGATARNGGHLKPAVYSRLPDFIAKYGAETASEYAEFEYRHVDVIAEVIEKENIECEFEMVRSFDVYLDPEQAVEAKNAYLKLKESGVAKQSTDDLIWTDEDRAEKASNPPGCVGCFSSRAATLWPYKLFMGILNKAVSQGLNLQTNTLVTSITSTSSTGTPIWTATTAQRGTISAPKLIIATNGYTSALLPEYHSKIIPARGTASHIVLPAGAPAPAPAPAPRLPGSYGIRIPGAIDYLNPRPDGSIVVGGARSTFYAIDSHWKNVVDNSALIEPAAHYFDTYMQRHFRSWEESGAAVEGIWTGVMG